MAPLPRRRPSVRPWPETRSATPCTACSRSSRSIAPSHLHGPSSTRRSSRGTRPRPRRSSTGSRRSSTPTATRSWHAASPSFPAPAPSGPLPSSTTASLLHGRLDVLWRSNGKALVADYKSNVLDGADPAEVVEAEYRLQRLVYALACLRAGADEAEIVYQFLERPGDLVSATFSTADVPALEARAVRGDRAHPRRRLPPDAGRVRVLGLPGARRRLRGASPARPRVVSGGAGRRPLRRPREPAGARGRAGGGRRGGRRRDRLCRRSRRRPILRRGLRPARIHAARALRARQRRSAGARGHRRVRHRLGSRAPSASATRVSPRFRPGR